MARSRNASQKTAGAREAPEPYWPVVVTLLAVGGLYMALPRSVAIGPRGLLLGIVCVLLAPALLAMKSGHHEAQRRLGFLILGIVTAAMAGSLILLVHALPTHAEKPMELLKSAVALWMTNVIVFAQWYWRLDAGGPLVRGKTVGHVDGAFVFPQMVMTEDARKQAGEENWTPTFVDYLFLAFNTSTALSPTDTMVLTRWAKSLMMVQSAISLSIIVLLMGRVVNIF